MKSRSEELFDSIKIFYDDPKNSQCLYDILEKKKICKKKKANKKKTNKKV